MFRELALRVASGRVARSESQSTDPHDPERLSVGGSSIGNAATELVQISVCLATYNGQQYVEEQIASILHQIGPHDEIVVVDDASTDATVSLLRGIRDSRIRVTTSATNTGHVAAFERALGLARGGIILLSDQDDIWLPGRVALMRQALVDRAYVASNWRVLGGGLPALEGPRLRAHDSRSPLWNIIRIYLGTMPYFGCAMGFRRDSLANCRT